MDKSKLKTRLLLILAAFVFGIASIDAFILNNILWGFLNLFGAGANLVALKYSEKHPELINVFLGILNAVISFLTAWIYIEEGKQYIQFAWILTGIFFLVMSYVFLNKAQKKYL